ncbi:MAG: hypothetical protein GOVbin1096_106 [Prokaryotic dsDNA virus sp.]|nr:MAG: hypothetical protein GOVbin1096_106 [Prokaryotic dsDNA virus sp.]
MKQVEVEVIPGLPKVLAYPLKTRYKEDDLYVGAFSDGSGVFILDFKGISVAMEPEQIDEVMERLRYCKEHCKHLKEIQQ